MTIEEKISKYIKSAKEYSDNCIAIINSVGLGTALEFCSKKGINPPKCSLSAISSNADLLRKQAKRKLSDKSWWEKRLKQKALMDFESEKIKKGEVTNMISDESHSYYIKKH